MQFQFGGHEATYLVFYDTGLMVGFVLGFSIAVMGLYLWIR
jgi:hypothetical protein